MTWRVRWQLAIQLLKDLSQWWYFCVHVCHSKNVCFLLILWHTTVLARQDYLHVFGFDVDQRCYERCSIIFMTDGSLLVRNGEIVCTRHDAELYLAVLIGEL